LDWPRRRQRRRRGAPTPRRTYTIYAWFQMFINDQDSRLRYASGFHNCTQCFLAWSRRTMRNTRLFAFLRVSREGYKIFFFLHVAVHALHFIFCSLCARTFPPYFSCNTWSIVRGLGVSQFGCGESSNYA